MVKFIGDPSGVPEEVSRRARRERQIGEMIQEHFNELAATDEEIATAEKELWSKPGLAQDWLCLTNMKKTAVNMLYMCIAVGNLRLKGTQ
ncbi:MAG: hypothetical protein LAO24_05625 [Acidobacteriia bacterium]|nr:hypothetical protein [Terriglobia bacterium]